MQALITLRTLSSDGVQQKGDVLYTTHDEPIEIAMGDENVPAGAVLTQGCTVQLALF